MSRFISLPRTVIALGLVSLFNDAGSEIIYPLLPAFITHTLGASIAFVGVIEGVAESVASLLKLFAGWFSDRIGKRKALIVAGYGIATLVRPLLAFTAAASQVLFLRFLDRLGKGLRSAPRDALIADAAPASARGLAFGFHRAMDHTGAIIGSLIAAGLMNAFENDYRRVFLVAAIPGLIAVLLILFAVRERKTDEPEKAVKAELALSRLALTGFSPGFKKFLLILFLFGLTCSSDAFLLLRAGEAGVSAAMIPLLWALLHVSKTISSVIGGSLSDRFGRRALIIGGWLIYALIYVGFAFASGSVMMWLLFAAYGIYFGCTEGVEKALVADLVLKSQRGTAFGLYNLIIGISALPASLLLGLLWKSSGAEVALLSSAIVSLLAAVLMLSVKMEHPQSA